MPRPRRNPIPVVAITVATTVPLQCSTCQAPAAVRVDVAGAVRYHFCEACYQAWRQLTPGQDGQTERLVELRG